MLLVNFCLIHSYNSVAPCFHLIHTLQGRPGDHSHDDHRDQALDHQHFLGIVSKELVVDAGPLMKETYGEKTLLGAWHVEFSRLPALLGIAHESLLCAPDALHSPLPLHHFDPL